MRPLRRFAGICLGLLFGLLTAAALPASPASAHAALIRTSPVQGSVVPDAPSEIVITFSEHVVPVKNKIRVIAPDGKRVDKGNPTVSGDDLHIPVRTSVPHGTYLVSYRVISADSHPVGAGFSYSVGAPSATAATVTDSGHTDPVVATGVPVLQYLGFAGLILLAGPALILFALWPQRLDRRAPVRLAYIGAGVVAVATVLELYLQAPYSTGTGLFDVSGGDLRDVLVSRYGQAHLARLVILALALLVLRPHLAGRGRAWHRVALVVLGVLGVATWSVSGHPGASTAPALTVIADMAHLASVAVWMGGLVMLSGFLLRRANSKELGAILPVWSNWAAMAVLVLVLAGTAQALVEIGTLDALTHTGYGQLLLLKIGLLVVILGFAYFSRRFVINKREQSGTVRSLRRTVLAEVVVAVLVLGVASVLVQTTPARTAEASYQSQTNGPFSVTLTSPLYQLQVDVDPAKVGDNELHLYAYTPQGAPLKVAEWKATAALPSGDLEPVTVPLLALTDSHATGSIALPTAGRWQLTFTLRTTEIDEATVSTTVNIT